MKNPAITAAALALAVVALYGRTLSYDFVHLDDPRYVTDNPHVATGLSAENLGWAFTTGHAGIWQPLTWVSLMLDAQLFGVGRPGGFHATNVVLHALNVALLFLFLARCTGRPIPSALAAALFAVHPLRVESVAWITERKDVLSVFFALASLFAYRAFVRQRGGRPLALTAVLLALGLMAKPLLVTLPFAYLLLDYWPLQRGGRGLRAIGPLVREKIPLFGLALLVSSITLAVQRAEGAVPSAADLPLAVRLAHVPGAYLGYLGHTVWPRGLCVFYPHPGLPGVPSPSPGEVAVAGSALLLLTGAVLWRGPLPLRVGWLWFLGTLVPNIGLVQSGPQAMADRFSYLPHIGLLTGVVFGGAEVLDRVRARLPRLSLFLSGAMVAATAALAMVTSEQLPHWRGPLPLYRRALEVGPPTATLHAWMGQALEDEGRQLDALLHYQKALEIDPLLPRAHARLGWIRLEIGRPGPAVLNFETVLRVTPDDLPARVNLATALIRSGRALEAQQQLERVLARDPDHALAQYNLGVILRERGDVEGARDRFRRALASDPELESARQQLESLEEPSRSDSR